MRVDRARKCYETDADTRYDPDAYIFLAHPSLGWGVGQGHAHAGGRSGQNRSVSENSGIRDGGGVFCDRIM